MGGGGVRMMVDINTDIIPEQNFPPGFSMEITKLNRKKRKKFLRKTAPDIKKGVRDKSVT